MTLAVVLVFFVLAVIGMPLAFALGIASLGGLQLAGVDLTILPQRMLHAVDNFPLMAIPLFILAGRLLEKAGIVRYLVDFAQCLVGRVHGGLAHIAIISGMLFGAVSGAAVASASALGTTLVPALRKSYPVAYSSAVVAAAANLGPIIPPSNAMIVYALMAGAAVSVGDLFMAGVVPGLLLAGSFMALASWQARRRGYPLSGQAFSLGRLLLQTRRALVILLMPVVVLGGIVGGVFTATEGAAIAVVYALVIGFAVTRSLKLSDLPDVLFRAAVESAVVTTIIAFAATVTFVLTIDLLPLRLSAFLRDLTDDPLVFILLVMALLVVVGMFIESNAAYIMLVPLLSPIALSYGIDPLVFGFLFVLNLVVGMMTPPVGVLLIVMCSASKVSMGALMRHAWPYVVVQYAVLLLCLAVPALITALPQALR